MNRVLVTGATGFVGRHLVEVLSRHGIKVTAAMREPSQSGRLRGVGSVVRFDLASAEELTADQLRDIDCVYHLAARVHVMREQAAVEDEFFSCNVNATETLARSAAKAGVQRFIYLSSIKANGEKTIDRPIGPHDPARPEDAYGRSKLAAERVLNAAAAATGLEVVIVRPPLVYGSWVGANFLRLLSLVDSGVPLPLGAVTNQRSMIAVWNLVSLLMHVATHPHAPGSTWLASDGEDVSTPRLIQTIAAALKRRIHLIPVPVPVLRFIGLLSGRAAEVERLVDSLQVDISVTRQVLGWRPPITVNEGIARTVAWFRELHRAAD